MSGPEGDEETSEAAAPTASAHDGAEDVGCSFGYDSCGAMDLSSCASSKAHDTDDNEDAEDEEGEDGEDEEDAASSSDGSRKRSAATDAPPRPSKRKWTEEEDCCGDRGGSGSDAEEDSEDKSVKSLPPKIRNKRRNIKCVIEDERLEAETKAAKAEEQERLNRLADQQKQLYLEVRYLPRQSLNFKIYVR